MARQNLPERLKDKEEMLRSELGDKEFELIYRAFGQGGPTKPGSKSGGAMEVVEAEILVRTAHYTHVTRDDPLLTMMIRSFFLWTYR